MPSLIEVSPAPLVIVVVSLAVVTLIVREVDTLKAWSSFPIIPLWRIFGFLRSGITFIRLAYLTIIFCAISAFLSLVFLITGGHPTWLDELVVLLLLGIHALLILWAIYYACMKWEPIIPPKELHV